MNAIKNPLYTTPDRAYTNAGACALEADDLDGAENYLQTALRLGGESNLVARIQLAQLFYRKGRLDDAKRALGETLKVMEPPSPDALWLALRVERKLGNADAQESLATQLRRRFPGSREASALAAGQFGE